jgi:fructose-bisphosphate aldolase class 1
MVAENGSAQPTPTTEQLTKTASRLAAKGKGLLASDESIGTIGKRIEKAGLANTEVRQKTLSCHGPLGK